MCYPNQNVRGRPPDREVRVDAEALNEMPRLVRVDGEGLHAFTGCHKGGHGGGRMLTHNSVRDTSASMYRYCGYRPRIEARYDELHMRRGDITVTMTGTTKQSIIDSSQTSSYPANGGSLSMTELNDVDHTKKVLQMTPCSRRGK